MKEKLLRVNGMIALWAVMLRLSAYAGELQTSTLRTGGKVMVEWQKKWWPAEILKVEKDRCFIRYEGWGDSWNEWVGPDRMKTVTPCDCAKGSLVQVEWKGGWYLAEVIEVMGDTYRIHYLDWEDSWDEVVGVNRVRDGGYKVGDDVMVEWKGAYYPATILKVDDSKGAFFIRYQGYGDEWNEWVTPRRLYKTD